MANEIRVRANFVAGQLSSAMLTGDTTIQGAGLADLPAIGASEYAPIAIFRTDNAGRVTQKEIVWVTAHTAGATTATATRGREGTTAQAWNVGDRFSHTDTALDNLIVCTAATRPATPFEGLEIYERDTGLKQIWTGAAWRETDGPSHIMKAYRTANYSHAAGWGKVPLNATHADPTSKFNAANNRYVCTLPGTYKVWGHLEAQLGNNPQRFILGIRRNDLEDNAEVRGQGITVRNGTAGDVYDLNASGEMQLGNAGDHISLWFYNNGGNAVTVTGNAVGWGAQLWVRRVGSV